jgi:uncharacterized protein
MLLNWKKINLYLLFAFSISWSAALLMKLTHIEYGTIMSTVIIAALYMPGPALATFIVQKFIYKEKFKTYGWTFNAERWNWIFYTILIFLALILLTFLVILILGNIGHIPEFGEITFLPENFNNNLRALLLSKNVPEEKLNTFNLSPLLILGLALVQGTIAGITLNVPFMFGEEFGWRGLLLRETQPMGFTLTNIFIGIIWGLWHLPVILMGHNYPHYPYFGIVMMCLFTTSVSPLFGYVRFKTQTILGPCMLHGTINATGAIYALYIVNGNELYSSLAGWAGIMAGCILTACIYIFDRPFVKNYTSAN